jgi:lipoate-protein ligase A
MESFLQNTPIREMALKLNIDLDKIRQESMTKEKEKARVINLENEVMQMREQMKALLAQKETKTEIKEDVKEEKLDKRSKEYRALKAQEAEQAQENK